MKKLLIIILLFLGVGCTKEQVNYPFEGQYHGHYFALPTLGSPPQNSTRGAKVLFNTVTNDGYVIQVANNWHLRGSNLTVSGDTTYMDLQEFVDSEYNEKWTDGKAYFFKDSLVYRYTIYYNEVDTGYSQYKAKRIRDLVD